MNTSVKCSNDYWTDYSLTVRKVKSKEQYDMLVHTLEEFDLIGYAFRDGIYDEKSHEAIFLYFEAVKWKNHPSDMVVIAEKFPKMYFELSCMGEDYDRFWKEYYHDMDIEVCTGEVVYEQPKKVQWTELMPF